jgi:outer membrane protein TolC
VSVGVLLSWNLFDGLRTSNRVKEADAEAARTAILLGERRQTHAHDAAAKRQSIEMLENELRLAEAELEVAKKKLVVMTQRHAAGNASDLDRQGAQLGVEEAETAWLVARIDLIEAQVEYVLRFGHAPLQRAGG